MKGERIQRYLLPSLLGPKCAIGKSIQLGFVRSKTKNPRRETGINALKRN